MRPDQLATIIYTSGTTGEPKGVMLSHANLVSNVKAGAHVLQLTEQDVALSFLPLSHSFERTVSYIYLLCGVTVVFAESFDTIGRDLGRVRPTLLTGVPRVFEKLHDRIMEKGQAEPGLKGSIFSWAVGAGAARGEATLRGQSARNPRLASGNCRRPSCLRQDPRGTRRPHSIPGVRQRAARRPASPSSSKGSVFPSSKATA